MSLTALCLSAALSFGVAAEPLLLAWPDSGFRQTSFAYLGASLVPLVPSSAPATTAAFLGRAPFVVGEGRVAIDLAALPADARARLSEAAGGAPGPLPQAAFELAGAESYLATRPFPDTRDALAREAGIGASTRWDSVVVDSLNTRSARRVHFRIDAVLGEYLQDGLPEGALFVADELDAGGRVRETHVHRLRADRWRDYALYDAEGRRRLASPTAPSRFTTPLDCLACHSGGRRKSPFFFFPDPAPLDAGFQPGIRESLTPAEKALVKRLSTPKLGRETHGDYAGLAAVRLLRRAAVRPLEDWERTLLERLGLAVPR
jgi:hypothetical protein